MSSFNLDLIRLVLDGTIALCCLVVMIRIWRQPPIVRTETASAARRSAEGSKAEIDAPRDAPRSTGLTPGTPLSPPGRLKAEVLRLTRLGLSVTEIARRTGLAQSEVALIQKFPPQG